MALAVAGLLNLVDTVTGFALLPLSEDGWHRGDTTFGLTTACLGFGRCAPPLARLATATVPRGLLVIGAAVALVAATPVPWPALPLLALVGATSVVAEPAHRDPAGRRTGPLPRRRAGRRRHGHGRRLPGRQPGRARALRLRGARLLWCWWRWPR